MDRRYFLTLAGSALTLGALTATGCGGGSAQTAGPGGTAGGSSMGVAGAAEIVGPVVTDRIVDSYDASGGRYDIVSGQSSVARIGSAGDTLWSVTEAGNGQGQLNFPRRVAANAEGVAFVADMGNGRIQAFDAAGRYAGVFTALDVGGLRMPSGVALDGQGSLFVCDALDHRVVVMDMRGRVLRVFGTQGLDGAALNGPRDVAFAPSGHLVVADSGNCRLQVYTGEGVYLRSIGSRGRAEGQMMSAESVVVDASGTCYVADPAGQWMHSFTVGGRFLGRTVVTLASGRAASPVNLALTPAGTLAVSCA